MIACSRTAPLSGRVCLPAAGGVQLFAVHPSPAAGQYGEKVHFTP